MTVPIKDLKEALTAFGKLVVGDKFRANYNYTRDVFSAFFKKYDLDKHGKAKRVNAKPKEMISTLVFICVHYMQKKAEAEAKKAEEAKK